MIDPETKATHPGGWPSPTGERHQAPAEGDWLARLDWDSMCEAFARVIEAQAHRDNPFHNPINADAMLALRELRGAVPAIKAANVQPKWIANECPHGVDDGACKQCYIDATQAPAPASDYGQEIANALRAQGEREPTYQLQHAFNRAAMIVEGMMK